MSHAAGDKHTNRCHVRSIGVAASTPTTRASQHNYPLPLKQQVEGKPELRSSQELQEAYANPQACLDGALLLLATADGAELSADAAAAAPLAPVPAGPRPLPVVGNMTLYFKVGCAVCWSVQCWRCGFVLGVFGVC